MKFSLLESGVKRLCRVWAPWRSQYLIQDATCIWIISVAPGENHLTWDSRGQARWGLPFTGRPNTSASLCLVPLLKECFHISTPLNLDLLQPIKCAWNSVSSWDPEALRVSVWLAMSLSSLQQQSARERDDSIILSSRGSVMRTRARANQWRITAWENIYHHKLVRFLSVTAVKNNLSWWI